MAQQTVAEPTSTDRAGGIRNPDRMRNGGLCLLGAAALIGLAVAKGGWAWFFVWPALSLALVGLGYVFDRPNVFGKRPDGTVSRVNKALILPYLLGNWAVWHTRQAFSTEPPYHKLTDTILIGRRQRPHEFPPNIDAIVDLTCEFREAASDRPQAAYHSFPILDGTGTDPDRLRDFLERIDTAGSVTFIHCAAGHGRVATVAASLLLKRGVARDADDAAQMVQAVRPLAVMGADQRGTVEAMARIYASA